MNYIYPLLGCILSVISFSSGVSDVNEVNAKDVQFSVISGKVFPLEEQWPVLNWQAETNVHLKGGHQKAFIR